jgi:hypothetical protein
MSSRRFGSIVIAGVLVATGYAGFKVKVAVHPSVSEQLDAARNRALSGNNEEAASYASAMLMGEKLAVHVDYGDTPDTRQSTCDQSIEGAFKMWQTALDNKVTFAIVPAEEKAAITIHLGKNVKLDNNIVSGYIKWTRSVVTTTGGVKPLFAADIHLRTTDPRGRELSFESMRHTCGHEFGHMFGLDDVKSVGMLMGPLDIRKPVVKPTMEEIETVKAIREECESIVFNARLAIQSGTHAQHFDGTCSSQAGHDHGCGCGDCTGHHHP